MMLYHLHGKISFASHELSFNIRMRNVVHVAQRYSLLRMSPSCSGRLSGMPWQMTSLTDVQQDLGKL